MMFQPLHANFDEIIGYRDFRLLIARTKAGPCGTYREWWSSLGGWILIYAAGWLALFGTAIFGTYLVLPNKQAGSTELLSKTMAALTWALSVVGESRPES